MSDEAITVKIDRDTANALRRLHERACKSGDADDLDPDDVIFELIEEGFEDRVRSLKQFRDEPILTDEESSSVPRFRDNRADFSKI